MGMRKRLLAVAVLTALSLFAAACGGDEGGTATSEEPSAAGGASEPAAEEPSAEESAAEESAAAEESSAAEEPSAGGSETGGAAGAGGVTGEDGEPYSIAFIPGCTCDPYYFTEINAVEAAGEELGVEIFVSGPANFDAAEQTQVLQAVIQRAPDAIIIDPTDAQAMVAPIEAAVEQGIPVMTTGNNVNTDVVFTRIAASSIEGGRAAAETMIELAPEGGPMLIVNVAPGISSTDDRDTGFREILEGEDAFEVLDTQFSDDDQNEAANIVTSTLQANPELAGIFATNVINANGVASALRLAGRDDIPAIGYDASIEMAQALEEGLLDAIISQDPAGIGQLAVEDTIAHLNGEEVPADQPLEPLVITQENLDTPEGQAGVYSEQS